MGPFWRTQAVPTAREAHHSSVPDVAALGFEGWRAPFMESKQPSPQAEVRLIHEVATALTVAKGRAQLLHRRTGRIPDEADQAHFRQGLEAIDMAVMRAHACVADYLDRQDHPWTSRAVCQTRRTLWVTGKSHHAETPWHRPCVTPGKCAARPSD